MKKILPFEKCCSHPDRLLADHHGKVAMLMHQAALNYDFAPSYYPDLVKLVGMFHDIGKATWYFQLGRLKGERIPKNELGNHASLSALLCFSTLATAIRKWCPEENDFEFHLAASVMAIRRHHGNVKDFVDTFDGLLSPVADTQVKALDLVGVQKYCEKVLGSVGISNFEFKLPEGKEIRRHRRRLRKVLDTRTSEDFIEAGLLFSLLVWADKIDAATAGNAPDLSRVQTPVSIVDTYRKTKFGEPSSELDYLRSEVYETVERVLLESNSRLFTLTAPTGSAKTLAVLNAAIKLKAKIAESSGDPTNPPRVIYCLPFTSIIDQNFDVFTDVFEVGGINVSHDLMLKHHHLVSPNYQDHNETDFGYNVGQLLVSSWDSEIIVTTFIQLLNSIIGNRNKMLRKVTRIPGSIILLDEVQAIPRKYWETIEQVLRTYANKFDCRFVLLTATRPLILAREKTVELLPNYQNIFRKFDRYTIFPKCDEAITFSTFKETIAEQLRSAPGKRHLVVMNTVQGSIELFQYLFESLREEFSPNQFCYLSTNITPRDRRQRIKDIRDSSGPGVIVSTQVVEAGVDISVDVVHRDLAPLDSIIQSAGRCNRSNERPERGEVYIWKIEKDDSRWRYSFIYSRLLLDVTQNLLVTYPGDSIPETAVLELSEAYFIAAKNRLADSEVHELVNRLEFQKVHEEFRLIEDDGLTESYFVNADDDQQAEELWSEFQDIRNSDDSFSRKSRLQKIKKEFFDRVVNVRLPHGSAPSEEILKITNDKSHGDYYDKQVGFTGNTFAIF